MDRKEIRRRGAPHLLLVVIALVAAAFAPARPARAAGIDSGVSGRVTNQAGHPLAGMCVSASGGAGTESTHTDVDGTYHLALAAGTYTIQFFPGCGGPNYAIEWYLSRTSYNGATPVVVPAGTTVGSIDAVMAPAGTITGRAVDSSGAPVPGTCVYAYLTLPGGQNITYNDVITGSDGSYTLLGMLAATYTVEFVPGCSAGSPLSIQWYPKVMSQDEAAQVPVTAGATTGGIDAQLFRGGAILGKVTDSAGHGLAGICVNPLETIDGRSVTFVEGISDANGNYTVNGLPAGAVSLEFFAGCGGGDYVTTWYGGVTPATVTLSAGQQVGGINATMAPGGALAGTVTDTAGHPLDGICVEATDGPDTSSTLTDGTGRYRLGGLPAGRYTVDFRSGCSGGDYVEQWYPGAPSAASSEPVGVSVGATTGGIDGHLTPASGTTPDTGSTGSSGPAAGTGSGGGTAAGSTSSSPTGGVSSVLGYWEAGPDGAVYPWGTASGGIPAGSLHPSHPVVAMAATPTGRGYWLAASDGGIFTFGDARFFGSTGALRLNRPIVGMAATASGQGYRLVASDGGIFTFGDAGYFGSTGALRLVSPIVGMAATPDGAGYWLAASDGGVFCFGDAAFHGSAASRPRASNIVAIARTPSGRGYWLAGANGGIFWFGDAGFDGSADAYGPGVRVVALSPSPT